MAKKMVAVRILEETDDELMKFAKQYNKTRLDLFIEGALLLIRTLEKQKPASEQSLPAFFTN